MEQTLTYYEFNRLIFYSDDDKVITYNLDTGLKKKH